LKLSGKQNNNMADQPKTPLPNSKCELHIVADNMAGLFLALVKAVPLVHDAIMKNAAELEPDLMARMGNATLTSNFIFDIPTQQQDEAR
jgi:hypothetical protein